MSVVTAVIITIAPPVEDEAIARFNAEWRKMYTCWMTDFRDITYGADIIGGNKHLERTVLVGSFNYLLNYRDDTDDRGEAAFVELVKSFKWSDYPDEDRDYHTAQIFLSRSEYDEGFIEYGNKT